MRIHNDNINRNVQLLRELSFDLEILETTTTTTTTTRIHLGSHVDKAEIPTFQIGQKFLQPPKSLSEAPYLVTCQARQYPCSPTRRIHFDTVIKVATIPSCRDYSDHIKRDLWSSREEIQQNAMRNRREFAAEGWNWECAVEEDAMFFDKVSNEYIHPVHLGGLGGELI